MHEVTQAESTTGTDDSPADHGRTTGLLRVATVIVLVVLAATAGLIIGSRAAAGPGFPADGSVDAGFARDMGTHHSQAVQMSTFIRESTEDPEVRGLALDILLGQQQQAGQMYGWLELWGLPQTSDQPVMGWMQNHDSRGGEHGAEGPMPGMATQEDLNRLAAASGREAERLYLQLMIPHHQAGVDMAQYAADNADQEVVRELARNIVNAQSAELTVLNDLLQARGGPLPP